VTKGVKVGEEEEEEARRRGKMAREEEQVWKTKRGMRYGV
jgi:hypothetical protein